MAGTVNISGQILGVPGGPITIGPFGLAPSPQNLTETQVFQFGSGANITVPSWANGLIFIPPPTNTDPIVLKGISGDTGFQVSSSKPSIISFDGTTDPDITGFDIFVDMTSASEVTWVLF